MVFIFLPVLLFSWVFRYGGFFGYGCFGLFVGLGFFFMLAFSGQQKTSSFQSNILACFNVLRKINISSRTQEIRFVDVSRNESQAKVKENKITSVN